MLDTKANLRQENDRLKALNSAIGRDLKMAYIEVAELAQDRDSWRACSMDDARVIDKLHPELGRLRDDVERLEVELDCAEDHEEELHERIRFLERQSTHAQRNTVDPNTVPHWDAGGW